MDSIRRTKKKIKLQSLWLTGERVNQKNGIVRICRNIIKAFSQLMFNRILCYYKTLPWYCASHETKLSQSPRQRQQRQFFMKRLNKIDCVMSCRAQFFFSTLNQIHVDFSLHVAGNLIQTRTHFYRMFANNVATAALVRICQFISQEFTSTKRKKEPLNVSRLKL